MKKTIVTMATAGVAVTLFTSSAAAQDARTMAMGGAGIASSYGSAAALSNPARLLSNKVSLDFGVNLSLEANDIEDSMDTVDKLSDTAKRLESRINSIGSVTIAGYDNNFAQLGLAAKEFNEQFKKLDGGLLGFKAEPSVVTAYHCEDCTYGFGLVIMGTIEGVINASIDSSDTNKFDALANAAADGVLNATDATTLQTVGIGTDGGGNFTFSSFNSNSEVMAVAAARYGLSVPIARQFSVGENAVNFGLTPKIVRLTVVDQKGKVNNFKAQSDELVEKQLLTFDLGAHYAFDDTNFSVGAVLKDLIGGSVKAKNNGTEAVIAPQLSVGGAYEGDWFTLASDLDLNKTELVKDGKRATQFLSLGAEATMSRWASLRLGYRSNLVSDSDVKGGISVGVGLLKDAVELTYLQGDDDQKGVALQVGFAL